MNEDKENKVIVVNAELVQQSQENLENLHKAAHLAITGDISKMTMIQKAEFLVKLATAEGIPAFPPPYAIGTDPKTGKEKIISTKNRAESLRKRDGISTRIIYSGPLRMGDKVDDTFYEVEVEGQTKDGRVATDKGVNFLGSITGQEKANKILGAITKAQNRVTNSLSGSGLMDESEAEASNMKVQVLDSDKPRQIAPRTS